jgi:hypothetical protein
MRALTRDFPPVGSINGFAQTRHLTIVALFPKVICSFLHFGQRILTNLLVDSLIIGFMVCSSSINVNEKTELIYKDLAVR